MWLLLRGTRTVRLTCQTGLGHRVGLLQRGYGGRDRRGLLAGFSYAVTQRTRRTPYPRPVKRYPGAVPFKPAAEPVLQARR